MGARAELVRTPYAEKPYRIIFWRDDEIIGEVPVSSLDAAIAVAEDLIGQLQNAGQEPGLKLMAKDEPRSGA